MGLFDYLNITPVVATPANKQAGVPEISSPTSVETENNDGRYISNITQEPVTDYSKLFQEKGIFGALEGINKDREKAYEDEVARTKAERAKSFFGSLATLGGQAIASAMGARKFNPIQSQVPKYNERLQRLRDEKRAYDAQSQNKSLSMIFQEYDRKRKNEAAQASADLKYKRDLTMKQIDQAFQIGMLDAKGKQALEQQAVKAKDAKELAALNHRYKLGEISTKANSNNAKVVDSVIGSDGNIYTRNTRLTPNEAQQIVLGSGMSKDDLAPFLTQEKDAFGNVIKTKTDWQAAAAYVLQKGMVPAEELIDRGFKRNGRTEKEEGVPLGIGWDKN